MINILDAWDIVTNEFLIIFHCVVLSYMQQIPLNKYVFIFFFHFCSESRQLCETKECILAASSILKAMDQTVDPCTDFYKYACGGWERDTPIPPGYSMWDRIQELSYTNLHHLKDILGNQRGINFCIYLYTNFGSTRLYS